jgi:hypothetical protein
MDLVIDTSGITFQVGRGFEARLDKDGVHRRDKAGRTNLPLYAVHLIAFDEGGAETILVTVATDNPPKVTQGMSVRPERLQAMPWVQSGTNAVKVAYRADAVVPVTSANRPAPAPPGG